jgi:hypothetical protein
MNIVETISRLLNDWHEAGRERFNRNCSNLNYDLYSPKTQQDGRKYIKMNVGLAGAFMVKKSTGEIFRIKAYGVPNLQKCCGNIETITGWDLARLRHW